MNNRADKVIREFYDLWEVFKQNTNKLEFIQSTIQNNSDFTEGMITVLDGILKEREIVVCKLLEKISNYAKDPAFEKLFNETYTVGGFGFMLDISHKLEVELLALKSYDIFTQKLYTPTYPLSEYPYVPIML